MTHAFLHRLILRRREQKPHRASLHVAIDERNWRAALTGTLTFEAFSGGYFHLFLHPSRKLSAGAMKQIERVAPGATIVEGDIAKTAESLDLAALAVGAFAVSPKKSLILWNPDFLCVARPGTILGCADAAAETMAFFLPGGQDAACLFVPSREADAASAARAEEAACAVSAARERLAAATALLPQMTLARITRRGPIPRLRAAARAAAVAGLKRIYFQIPRLARQVKRLHTEITTPVHSLIGIRSYREVVVTIRSLEHFSERRWPYVLHDDGTLGDGHFRWLEAQLPGCRIIPRAQADGEVIAALAPYPGCQELRRTLPHSLKFFDFRHYAAGERLFVLDADVLFFARPATLLEIIDSRREGNWFNAEKPEAYCRQRHELELFLGQPVWRHVNSGVAVVERESLSLELVERFIGYFHNEWEHKGLVEQTSFALCASQANRGGLLPPEYEITFRPRKSASAVLRHYAAAAKFDMMYLEGVTSLLPRMLLRR